MEYKQTEYNGVTEMLAFDYDLDEVDKLKYLFNTIDKLMGKDSYFFITKLHESKKVYFSHGSRLKR